MYTDRIEITFDAGHRLLFYEGKCESPHGHSFKAEIMVAGDNLDQTGFVVDFLQLKNRTEQWINENWDHAFLINRDDRELLQALNSLTHGKIFIFENGNPTAENMSRCLYDYINSLYENLVSKVRVWEGPGQYAEYRGR
jgi:6-pyruvoyltetrahydropterin/6-carboxytetrahydropterin synthase